MPFEGGKMTKKEKRGYKGKAARKREALPFTSKNYLLFTLGLLLLIIGYIALSRGSWDSFWSLTLAPILLVIAYCIVIPIAILYHKRNKKQEAETK